MEFYNSSKYNPDYRYSFIYPNPVQPRILCPKCGNNTYKGYTNDLEWGADPKPCPDDPNLISDICTYYHHYECFFLRIPTVRKVCGGNQPATAGF